MEADNDDQKVYDTHLTMLGRIFVSAARKYRSPYTVLHLELVEELLSAFEHEFHKSYGDSLVPFYKTLKKSVEMERRYMISINLLSPAIECSHGNGFPNCNGCRADSEIFSLYCKTHSQGIKLPSEDRDSDTYSWVMKIPNSLSTVPDWAVNESSPSEICDLKQQTAMVPYSNPHETLHTSRASSETSEELPPRVDHTNPERLSEENESTDDMSEWARQRPTLHILSGDTSGKCYFCNYFGHLEKFCPLKHGKENVILQCEETVHKADEIKSEVPPINRQMKSFKCKRCGRVADHKPRDCWTEDGKPIQCFWCFEYGVTLKTCPNCRDRYVNLGGKYGAETRDPAARAQFVRVPGIDSPFSKAISSQRE